MEEHPDAQQALQTWYTDVKQADWKTPTDIKAIYRNASIVANNRVVFNIMGNKYRLVVAVRYGYGLVYIRFIGNHQEYDKIDVAVFEEKVLYMMEIKSIKHEANYEAALAEIEQLFEAKPGTPEGERLELLAGLVEAYEELHYSIPEPDPIEAIRYYMESRGLSRRDLEPCIGSRARVSEVLNRKRPLTLSMIRRLHVQFGIPAEVLIQPYDYQQAA